MKKNNESIKKIIIFLLILFALISLVVVCFLQNERVKYTDISEKIAEGILSEKENTLDIVAIGDSETFTSIIPLQLWNSYGFASYVCGTPSQYLDVSYNYLLRILEHQNPKVVILETNTIYRKITFDKFFSKWLIQNVPIFDKHDNWKMLYNNKKLINQSDGYKGFNFSIIEEKPKVSLDYMKESNILDNISLFNEMYLDLIKEACEEKNIKLILVSTPSVINWNIKKHNGVKKYAKENNLDYIDLNLIKKVNINWDKDTRDKGDHLNYYGAVKVTNYLGEYLKNLNILDDHRGEEEYNSWNKMTEDFYYTVQDLIKKSK